MLDCIGFDGDDTLWHSEDGFAVTQERFRALLADHVEPGTDVDAALALTERRNLDLFGYGVKGFTLSMIETAIEVSAGRVPATVVQELIDAGRELLARPVELLDGARYAVEALAGHHRLILVTKGDLWHQESKVARSGLGDLFSGIEIVGEKDEASYRRVLARHGVAPERFCMVGNSVRSDVLPVLAIGGLAVHVPYHVLWAHEHAEHDGTVATLDSLADLPAWLAGRGL